LNVNLSHVHIYIAQYLYESIAISGVVLSGVSCSWGFGPGHMQLR